MRRIEKGFTLVEVLATGVISTVLAGAILTLVYLGADEMLESQGRQKALAQYVLVQEQICRVARTAYTIRATGETYPDVTAGTSSLPGLRFFKKTPAGTQLGAFRVAEDTGTVYLRESTTPTALTFKTFMVGADSIPSAFSNTFRQNAARTRAGFQLTVKYQIKGDWREFVASPRYVMCRSE